jgi:aerobic-type carbon monoxide dehydrogenase small subunit (CoxS/CutS family)
MRLLHTRADHVRHRLRARRARSSDAAIREYMSGNLCRCAAYPNIVAAINQAKGLMKET